MDQLTHSLNVYQTIRGRILALEAGIDEVTLADTVEGLTDLHDVVAAIVRSALFAESLAEGLKGHILVLQARLARLNERNAERRRIARDAMIEADIKRIGAPDFTLSLRAGSPSVVVINEGRIPDAYWAPREPRLDRAGLLGDLKQGVVVPGAALSNPEPVLSVRVG